MLSIIIPCKNEPYLPELIKQIENQVKIPHEILIQTERGLSNAIVKGVKRSKGEIIAVMDGDGSHNPKYLNEMANYIGEFDMVIGSRYVYGSYNDDYVLRKILSRFYCKFARSLLGLKVADTMSGFVMAKKRVFCSITPSAGYKFALEMMVKNGGKIAECPIFFEERKSGYSKADPIQGLRILAFILELFLWSHKTKA